MFTSRDWLNPVKTHSKKQRERDRVGNSLRKGCEQGGMTRLPKPGYAMLIGAPLLAPSAFPAGGVATRTKDNIWAKRPKRQKMPGTNSDTCFIAKTQGSIHLARVLAYQLARCAGMNCVWWRIFGARMDVTNGLRPHEYRVFHVPPVY